MTKNEKPMLVDVRYLRDRCRNSTPSRSIKLPTLARALKHAKAKGMDVTIAPDGSVTFKSISRPETLNGNGADSMPEDLKDLI
ncbi:MAG: hypothetical protein WAV38_20160 [Xanthobacteraceae bacterium]